ncbi:hypothetical protein DFH06DRAFT_170985 [Mycena polygramma]|nr:hypothetical protein DFH06DRAFT_170985 [Mycena polygramma]
MASYTSSSNLRTSSPHGALCQLLVLMVRLFERRIECIRSRGNREQDEEFRGFSMVSTYGADNRPAPTSGSPSSDMMSATNASRSEPPGFDSPSAMRREAVSPGRTRPMYSSGLPIGIPSVPPIAAHWPASRDKRPALVLGLRLQTPGPRLDPFKLQAPPLTSRSIPSRGIPSSPREGFDSLEALGTESTMTFASQVILSYRLFFSLAGRPANCTSELSYRLRLRPPTFQS